MTLKRTVGFGLIGLLLGAGLLSMLAVPAFADTPDINFWMTNTGSSTGGGLTTNPSATGSATSAVMGAATFTFASAGYTYTKIGAGTDNFILEINSAASSGTVCMVITFTASTHPTDSATTCSSFGGNGLYTFGIPSSWGGLVTAAQTNTATITCTAGTTVSGGCAGVTLGWAGNNSSSSNIQIPSTVPEFGVATVLVGAVGLLGVALIRRSKTTSIPSALHA